MAKNQFAKCPEWYMQPEGTWVPYDLTRDEMKKTFNQDIRQFPLTYIGQVSPSIVGWGAHKQAGVEAKSNGITHALITTTGLASTGIVDEIRAVLKEADVESTVFDGVTTNPKDHQCDAAYAIYKEAGCDGVVSVGGGSSHDSGKAVRLLAWLDQNNDERKLRDFACNLNPHYTTKMPTFPDISSIPQVAVNCSTGTGAQFTSTAVINDTELQYKLVVVVPGGLPSVAIDDPLLHRTQPPHVLAGAGMDAIVHGLESLTGRLNCPVARSQSLMGIQYMANNLREGVGNPQNHQAMENLVWGMVLCSYGFLKVGAVGAVHTVAHMMGAMGDGLAHHGLANAIFMIPVSRWNMMANPQAYKDVGLAMGMEEIRHKLPIHAAEATIDELEKLRNDVGITNCSLKQFDWFMEDPDGYIEHAAQWGYNDFTREANNRQTTPQDIKDLMYAQIY
jgi:formaldehyde dismutase / methanol dehydrogenase